MNKDYGIVGIGDNCSKLVEDFRYIFKDILSLGDMTEWGEDNEDFRRKFECEYDCYICCTYDREAARVRFKSIGFVYRTDYFFAEDFFGLLDDWKGKRIAYKSYPGTAKEWIKSIVFGYAAKHGKVLPEDIHRAVLKGNYGNGGGRQSRSFFVYALFFMLGSLEALPQITSKEKGYRGYDRICFYSSADAVRYKTDFPSEADKVITVEELKSHTMASLYMRAVYFDRRQNACACDMPYNMLWIGRGGSTRLCECPDFLNLGCGNLGVVSASKVWDSPLARIIRLSVINNTYTFCARNLCAKLVSKEDQTSLLERREIAAKVQPSVVNFAGDYACNLHCPSCRKSIHARNDENEDLAIKVCIDDLVSAGWLDNMEMLLVGGSGETFLSKNYKRVLYESKVRRKSVLIMTNGTLFDHKEWERLEGKYEHISFMVSVDAATKETYEKVRCGGSFERLMSNLDFLSGLRIENKVDHVTVIMIVQSANYREIPDFIKWALDKGFDKVSLSHIRNWGSYDDTYFYESVSMFDRNGNMKPELAAVLGDPVCKDPIVDMRWAGSRNLS